MPKVPALARAYIDQIDPAALQVTDLEVRILSGRPALFLSAIGVRKDEAGTLCDGDFLLPLSPPAAAQLVRLLESALERYLYQPVEAEEERG